MYAQYVCMLMYNTCVVMQLILHWCFQTAWALASTRYHTFYSNV